VPVKIIKKILAKIQKQCYDVQIKDISKVKRWRRLLFSETDRNMASPTESAIWRRR